MYVCMDVCIHVYIRMHVRMYVQIILIINIFYFLTKVTKTKKSGLLH